MGHMEMLASDALQGRGSGTRDEWLAATYIASQLRRWGLAPLGDDGDFVQTLGDARRATRPAAGTGARDRVRGTSSAGLTWRGSHASQRGQVVLLSAHLDHLGVRGTGPTASTTAPTTTRRDRRRCWNWREVLARDAAGADGHLRLVWQRGSGRLRRAAFPRAPARAARLDRRQPRVRDDWPARPDGAAAHAVADRLRADHARAGAGARMARASWPDPHPEQNFFQRSDNIQLAARRRRADGVELRTAHDYHRRPTTWPTSTSRT